MRSRNLVWFAGVTGLVALLAATTSAGVISYNANADPAGETYDGYPTESGVTPWSMSDPAKTTGTSYVDSDYGSVLAWRVTDGNDNAWLLNATSADALLGESAGYTLTVRLRPATSASTGYSHVVAFNDTNDFQSAWMDLRPNPAGSGDNMFIKLSGSNDYIYEMVDAALGYHDYKLACSPAAGTMNLLVDGATVLSNVPLVDNSSWWGGSPPPSYVTFGDNTSQAVNNGTFCYNSVEWATVPEPGTLAILGTGLIGLLAYAWRKRK